MKTEMMLLIHTDGVPTLNVAQVAHLLNLGSRTVQNRIYEHRMPFPMFKLGESGEWMAHVSDVASYIDAQREAAAKVLENAH